MNARAIDDYLNLPYTIEVIRDNDPDNPGWVARVVELPGCITQADDFTELGEMIEDAMRSWITVAIEDDLPIPEPHSKENYSGKFLVRMPKTLHRRLVETADNEAVSLNQYVTTQLAQSVGAAKAVTASTPVVSSIDAPVFDWERLRATAVRLLISQGYQTEAVELSERLFASWMDEYIDQVDSTIRRAEYLQALHSVRALRSGLEQLCSQSPVIRTYCATVQLLERQIVALYQIHAGMLQQETLLQRAMAQVRDNLSTIPVESESLIERPSMDNDEFAGYSIPGTIFDPANKTKQVRNC